MHINFSAPVTLLRRALITHDTIVRKAALLGTLLTLIEPYSFNLEEDTRCFGPRCLPFLNLCRECFIAYVVFFYFFLHDRSLLSAERKYLKDQEHMNEQKGDDTQVSYPKNGNNTILRL